MAELTFEELLSQQASLVDGDVIDFGNSVSEVPAEPPSFLESIGTGAMDTIQGIPGFAMEIPGMIKDVGAGVIDFVQPGGASRLVDKLSANGGEGFQTTGRTALETAIGVPLASTGIGAAVAPGAMAAGGLAYDTIADLIQTGNVPEIDTLKQQLGERLGSYYTLGAGGVAANKGLQAVQKPFVNRANKLGMLENEAAATGTMDAQALGFPRNASGVRTEIVQTERLKKSLKNLDGTDVWQGGETFNPETLKFEGTPQRVTPDSIHRNIQANLPKVAKAAESTIDDLMVAQKELGIPNVVTDNLPIEQVQEIAVNLEKTFSTSKTGQAVRTAINQVKEDMRHLGGNAEGVSLKDLHTYKRNLYTSLRELEKFDINKAARASLNPSAVSAAEESVIALNQFSKAIDDLVSQKATEIITKAQGIDGFTASESLLNVRRLPPTKLDDLDRIYGALKDADNIGLSRAVSQLEAMTTPKPPTEAFVGTVGKQNLISRGMEKGWDWLYPPALRAEKRGQGMLSSLRKAETLRAATDTPQYSGLKQIITDAQANVLQSIMAQGIPRDTTVFDLPDEALAALPVDEQSLQQIVELRDSSPEIQETALADIIKANPQAFEPSPIKGFNAVGGKIIDPHERVAYADRLNKEEQAKPFLERDYKALSKKLTALNRDGSVIDAPVSKGIKKQAPDTVEGVAQDGEALANEEAPLTKGVVTGLADGVKVNRSSYSY